MATPHQSTKSRPRDLDSAALVKRIASGDKSAFATFYDTTCGLVYGLLLRILGGSEKAEQVLVAVYQDVWAHAATYDGEREKAMTWLVTMAHKRAIAQLRADGYSQSRQASFESAKRNLNGELKTDEQASEEQKFVQSAFAGLSPAQQQIIELTYFAGLRQNEISALLDLSLQSVQLGIRAAMRKLREASASNHLHPA